MKEYFHDSTYHNTYIDGRERGNLSRFFNHSCDPNMKTAVVRIRDCDIPYVGM